MKKAVFAPGVREAIRSFPAEIKDVVGRAILSVQYGGTPSNAKPLKGFGGGRVLEIRERDKDGAYRVVYTTKIRDVVVVLHAFKKKSTQGIKTPKKDMEIIRQRLQESQQQYDE